jgi:hypothetical protein
MTRRFDPTTQLNWLARYLPLLPHLDAAGERSLLEVGCGPRGIGSVLASPFVGVEVAFASPPVAPMLALEYGGDRLPFQAAAFHTVVSMDTLEHVPPAARRPFLEELARVAAARMLIGFPADAVGAEIDRDLAAVLGRLGSATPDWLDEHREHGLPEAGAVEAWLDSLAGWRWRALPTTGTLACLVLTLADTLPEVQRWIRPLLETHGAALAQWIAAASFGPSFRRVYLLERTPALPARVDLGAPATLWAALACPRCGAGADDEGAMVRCRGCGTSFAPDARGVRAVKSTAPATPAATFVLAPDWLERTDWVVAVHNYLHAFGPDDPCLLWLAVDAGRVSVDEALALLHPILAPFGTARFASLSLSDDPAERPPGACVPLGAAGADLRAWTPERFREAAARAGADAAVAPACGD